MRHDIQFLRGIAVLAVVLYHADLGLLTNGYLGVDIFFVISGFLITTIVLRGLAENTFSFQAFYLRRARRLLPGLYSTLMITTMFASFFLTVRQWGDYKSQLFGALTFTSNMVLPLQVGYFEDVAETKPLLHIWSLSLEEQYYFFLPLMLYLTPKRLRSWALAALLAVSLSLCLYFTTHDFYFSCCLGTSSASWAFFLFPTRAWELLAGSLSAWYMLRAPGTDIPGSIKIAALAGLALLLFVSIDDTHLRGNAIAAVLLTCLLILGKDNWLPRDILTRSIARIGDWSYSLYLIHWPLLSFAQVSFLGRVPPSVTLTLLAIAIGLAYFQYKYVEQPFRHGYQRSIMYPFRLIFGSTLVLFLSPFAISGLIYNTPITEAQDFNEIRQDNYGLDAACDTTFVDTWPDVCKTTSAPEFAVWGDSFAMHLVPGLRANPLVNDSIIQITKSSCGPILGMAVVDAEYNQAWAEACIAHNDRALKHILSYDSVKYVIMSSPFWQFFEDEGQLLVFHGTLMKQNTQLAISQMVDTISIIRDAGKIPIVVSPTPLSGFNTADCLERKANHAIVFGRSECNFTRQDSINNQEDVIAALKEVEKKTGAQFIWLDSLLCGDGMCQTKIKNAYLYRDQAHLSITGSEALLSDLNFIQH